MEALYPSLEDVLGALGSLINSVPMPLIIALPIVVWLRKREATRDASHAPATPGPDASLWAAAPPRVQTPVRVRDLAPAALGLIAVGTWIVANILPAVVTTDGTIRGWSLTLLGWMGIFEGPPPIFGRIGIVLVPLSIVGWSANAWALGAVLVRVWAWGYAERGVGLSFLAIALASVAVACSADGILWMTTSRYVLSIEIGTWVWFASLVVFLGSTLWWAHSRRHQVAATGRWGA